jgi:hypothetical protein
MFFTLASRIPLISGDKSSKKFFKIFIIGSIAYILLHYYLYSGERFAFLEKIKSYLYYVMVIDLIVAYFLSKSSSSEEENEDRQDDPKGGYTDNQRTEIEKNIQELRKMQMLQADNYRQKAIEQQRVDNEDTKSGSSQKSPFMTRDEVEESDKKNKKKETKSISSKKETTSESSEVVKEKKKKSKKEKLDTDTNLPVFMPNN